MLETMKTFDLNTDAFLKAIDTAIKGNAGSDTIETDSVVKLSKVIQCNEDSEDNLPSIMLVFEDGNAGTISDFRNFSGKTGEAFGKQLQAHNLVLNRLGADLDTISSDLSFITDESITTEDKFKRLYGYYAGKFTSVVGTQIGIEVGYDAVGKRHNISKYVQPSAISVVTETEVTLNSTEDNLPF
jgi:hypothetical protein